MQNEVETARQHAKIKLHHDVADAGVTVVDEDLEHKRISDELRVAHPDAYITKDAVPPPFEPTSNLAQFSKPKSKKGFSNLPIDSTNRWSGIFDIFKGEKKSKKGEKLQNAA